MIVSSTEFKTNLGKYLALVKSEDIYVTKYGKTVGRFTSSADTKLAALDFVSGIISSDEYPSDYMGSRTTIKEP